MRSREDDEIRELMRLALTSEPEPAERDAVAGLSDVLDRAARLATGPTRTAPAPAPAGTRTRRLSRRRSRLWRHGTLRSESGSVRAGRPPTTPTVRAARPRVRRGIEALLGTVTVALLLVLGLVATATSPPDSPGGGTGAGYVRLAHLSPDAPTFDVYLTSPSGAISQQVFTDVPYGVLSQYLWLPAGTYTVATRPTGAPRTEPPLLVITITVERGRAYTIAGVGRYANLGLRVIEEDITPAPSGTAKVRVVQASVRAPVVDVSVAGGQAIATRVAFATTTGYALVDEGRWTLRLQPAGGGPPSELVATMASGSVYTLIVLDRPGGGFGAQLRVDVNRRGVPAGGVDTGGGGTPPTTPRSPDDFGILLLLLLSTGLLAIRTLRARISPS